MGRLTSCLERKDSEMSYDPQLLEEGAIDKDSSLLVNTFEAETPSVLPPPLPKVDIDCSHLLKAVTGRKLVFLECFRRSMASLPPDPT